MTDDTDTTTPAPDPTPSPEATATTRDEAASKPARWRRWLAWTFLVLGTVLLVATSANLWIKRQALDTDSWVDASGKFLADDEIRGALSVYLVDELFENVDVSANVADTVSEIAPENSVPAELLGPLVAAIGPLVENALQEVAVTATDRVLGSAPVQELWKDANRVVHSALVAVVTEDSGSIEALSVEDGVVAIDLKPILAEVGTQLGIDVPVDELPEEAAEIVILESAQLEAVQDAVKVIQKMSVLLILIVLGLFGLAIYLPKGQRRRMVLACSVSLLLIGIVLLVVKTIAGQAFVDALAESTIDQAPINAVWGIGTELLVDIAAALIVYGLVLFIGAWLAGPSRPAVAVRRFVAPTFRDRPILAFAATVLIFLVVLLWSPTSADRELIGTFALMGAILVGVEALRRQTMREFPETPEDDPALADSGQAA